MLGSVFSLVWSIAVLAICMRVQIPNSSLYPEIDFASKCVNLRSEPTISASSASHLLYPLSNADSGQIRKRIGKTRFFVDVRESAVADEGHVEINTNGKSNPLIKGQIYGCRF